MKRITVNAYKILHKLTGHVYISYSIAVKFASFILVFLISGFVSLLTENKITKIINKLTTFPRLFIWVFLVMIIDYFVTPTKLLRKLDEHEIDYLSIILSILAAIALTAYKRFMMMPD